MGIEVDLSENRPKDFAPAQKPIEQTNEPKPNNTTPVAEPTPQPQKSMQDILGGKKPVEEQKPAKPVETKTEPPKPLELNDENVSAYIKSKYFADKEFNGLDQFLTTPEPQVKEVEKVVNPYEDVMDDFDKSYFKFKQETGRGFKEFQFLQEDIASKPPLELSRQKIRIDTGLQLTDAEADAYLEKKLNIDLSEELNVNDKIELNTFSKPYRDSLLEQQAKYKTPKETVTKKPQPTEDLVQLENGMTVTKAQYKTLEDNHKAYQEGITKAVNSVTAFNFKIPFDNNGEKTELDISYDISKEDKHSMLSDALDVDATIKREFNTENGFNHSGLAQTLYRGQEKNFNKIMVAVAEKVRAATIEELTANANNETFAQKPLQQTKTGKEGYGQLTGNQSGTRGFGVKINV